MEPGDVLHRLETKESRMHQLSALLETMKHESAGTAEAMERTLHENDTLQRMNQQLTHDLQAAIDATEQHKTDHAKQIQEVMTVFTDERRELEKKFELYMQTASDNLSALMRDQEATKGQHKAAMEALAATLQDVDTEKQELGKLLADAFHDLERCRAALLEANNNVTQLKTSLTQNDQSWTNTLTSLESQILESHAQQQLVKDALRVAEAALQVERSQKEELNAAMRTELQRYTDELDDVQTKHATSLAVVVAERNECQDRLSQVKERAKVTDKQLQALTLQFEDAMEGAKLTLAAKTADADKQRVVADRNLAEMNSQCIALAQDLAACQAARTDSEGKFTHLQQGCVKLSALVGIDSSSSMDSQAFAMEHAQLQQNLQLCTDELESVKQDCAALVVEMQSLTAAHDKALMDMQSSSQRKVDDAHAQQQALAVSTMQLQRSVDGQRARIDQLEDEKRELLQMDVDATKHRVTVLQSEHNDLQDAHDQLTAAMATDRTDWSAKLAESDALYQRDRHEWDEESRSLLATVATLEGQVTSLNELVVQAREDSDACRRHAADLAESLERTRVELIDAQDSCAEWKDKADGLAATSTLRADLTASSGQCLALAGDKRRLESTAASLETLNGQLNAELHTLRQEKQCLNKHLEGRDDELLAVQGDLAQVKAELERFIYFVYIDEDIIFFSRVARSKQTLQTELSRAAEDLNDKGCRKEMDMLRTDHMEAMALNEELQAKISTIQSAANATINDLVAELTHAEDLLKADQARRAQDDELLRSHALLNRLDLVPCDVSKLGMAHQTLYIAPEVLSGGPHSVAADVYSFGILLAELDTGESVYHFLNRTARCIPGRHDMTVSQLLPLRQALTFNRGSLQPAIVMCLQDDPRSRKILRMSRRAVRLHGTAAAPAIASSVRQNPTPRRVAHDATVEHPQDVGLQWRLARAAYDVASLPSTSSDEKKTLIYLALDVIQAALALDADNFAVHKW
ncbi:hypothetical protein DYB30_008050 [Aphanomyces astaci]|uniref:Protein kinase domain-containing protein n=1 Tax=Aphanomyces astaci TaxID=112090 RepID=A0A397E9J0_APHAT|nr:hypothetical protein DYB30_008050 [Aphanomyces astaci]